MSHRQILIVLRVMKSLNLIINDVFDENPLLYRLATIFQIRNIISSINLIIFSITLVISTNTD
jgi:hypothetical protein